MVEPEEFQMAPMIDMVFLLLVFFMTVSNLAQAQQRVELNLPESHESRIPEELSDRTSVSLQMDGSVFWGATPVSIEELEERIRSAMTAEPDLRIQIRADAQTPFEEIRKVLQACAEAGAYEIIYSTHEAG